MQIPNLSIFLISEEAYCIDSAIALCNLEHNFCEPFSLRFSETLFIH